MIKLYSVVLKESCLDSPFASKDKCWIVPLIQAGASALSGILNAANQNSINNQNWDIAVMNRDMQRETNQQNALIAREANAYNYRMFQEQNAFNRDMWDKTNSYNLPVNQVQRLIAAGINPAAYFGQASDASMVSSASSSPAETSFNTAPQLNYQRQPIDYGFVSKGISDFTESMLNMADLRNKQAEADYNEAKAEYEWNSLEARVQNEFNKSEQGSLDKEIARQNLDFLNNTKDARIKRENNEAEMSDKLLEEKQLDIASKQMSNEMLMSDKNWREKFNAANYNTLILTNRRVLSDIMNNDADSALKHAQEGVEKLKQEGLKISNKQAEKTVDIIVDTARETLYKMEDERYQTPFMMNYQMQGKAGQWLPEPSGKFAAEELHQRNIRRDRFKKNYRK